MSPKVSFVALLIVFLIIFAGFVGWIFDNEIFLLVAFVSSIILIGITLIVANVQLKWEFGKTLYSTKKFERLTSNPKQWTKHDYLKFYFGIGTVFLFFGLLLLFVASKAESSTAFLLGGGLASSGLGGILSGFVFRESDTQIDPDKKKQVLNFVGWFMMLVPFVIALGVYINPNTSKNPMLDIFGIIIFPIGMLTLLGAIWKVMKRLFRATGNYAKCFQNYN